MSPPTWLDAAGRQRPRVARWTCGREVAPLHLYVGPSGRTVRLIIRDLVAASQ
jgi:hypothetical protein